MTGVMEQNFSEVNGAVLTASGTTRLLAQKPSRPLSILQSDFDTS